MLPSNQSHEAQPGRFFEFRKITETTRFPSGIGLPGLVLAGGKPVWVIDVTRDDRFPRAGVAIDLGIKAGFAFPILVESAVSGVLEFFADQAIAPNEFLLELMAQIGTQLGRVLERRQAREKIMAQAALLDKAHDAILVQDLHDRILYWNRGAEQLYGWTAAQVLGRTTQELLDHDCPAEPEQARATLFSRGEWSGELAQTSSTGTRLTVASRWTLVCDADGKPKSKLVINSDITVKKKLESQVLRTQRLESIGTLAGGIAHDLNNVLTPIVMAAEMLEASAADAQGRYLLKLIRDNALRGSEMVKQVLAFARGTEGKPAILQITLLIADLVKMLKQTLPRSIEIKHALPMDLWLVNADATRLHQVLLNLCMNARDAMPHGGRLTLSAQNVILDASYARMNPQAQPGRYISIIVEDTGTGIPAGILERIFDPFFTTKDIGHGTGLGLSNALGIVKGHGGFINVHSELGRGARFSVYLPAVPDASSAHPANSPQRPLRGHGELILVVDDEPNIREITKATLEDAGYRVLIAEDGAGAVALYAEHRRQIRLVLTDMVMPIMDGPATVHALQKLDPEVCIVVASGYTATDRTSERLPGITWVLSKPYTAKTLLTVLQDVLAQRPGRK
jgi:PAS domain S-box-containing protein